MMVVKLIRRVSSLAAKYAVLALCLLLSPSFISTSHAGGWPPYGAWAYGSGWPAGGAVRTRSVYRGYPFGGVSYRSRSVYRSGYGLRYAWPSYSAYRGAAIYRSSYAWPTYYRTHYRVAYRPVLAAPVYYSPIVIPAPVTYHTSFFATTGCWPSPAFVYSSYLWPTFVPPVVTPICTTPILTAPVARALPTINISSPLVLRTSTTAPDTSLTINSTTQAADVPKELISAADAILRVGGYREAAKAYAELSLRYGTSEALLARRFVANVLNRDYRQAEVISELSTLLGFELDQRSLDDQRLKEFVGEHVSLEPLTEKLAELALRDRSNASALRSVATWLSLNADQERSTLFFAAAGGTQNAIPQTNSDTTTFVARVESE